MTATATPTSIPVDPLPRDIDVTVLISRPQYETASDLSLLCFATPNVNYPPNNSRVRTYMDFNSVVQDAGWTPSDTGYWAAKAFFDQSVRPARMAVGRVFETPVPAQIMAAVITDIQSLKSITTGSFSVDITASGGSVANVDVEGINFSSVTTIASVAAAINTAISVGEQSTILEAGIDYGGRLIITDRTGGVSISYAGLSSAGTNVSDLLNLTQEAGAQKWDAYIPTGLAEEIRHIALAARAGGFPIYAWAIDEKYRDTQDQREVADWAETQNWKAWALLCTNSPTAYDSADTTNIGFYCQNLAYKATAVVFSDVPQQYPEIAYATSTLAVNYGIRNSVVTACFKDASGISPSNIDVTKHDILESRRINMFVRVGNNARTYRYGMQSAPSWWTDSYAGACNLREELQVAGCNTLYRNKKIPYSTGGQTQIVSPVAGIGERYIYNGYLADRDVTDLTNENGYSTLKAYKIDPTPIYRATDTERANRILPGINLIIYEAGAIHHVNIMIDLVN
jgi:hypothetical protein